MTNTIDRRDFETAIEQVGYEDIRDAYSGRFMYGKTCIGVVLESYSAGQVGPQLRKHAEIIREEVDALQEDDADMDVSEGMGPDNSKYYNEQLKLADNLETMAESVRVDSMGLSLIVYWPGWEFSD